jgi:N6-adenosine-specific RNA methylase IME4
VTTPTLPKEFVFPASAMEPERLTHYRCDYWKLLPPLTTEERDQLKASIEAHGIQTPISGVALGNCQWLILDGYNRLDVAHELGFYDDDIPLHNAGTIEDFTPEDLEALAYSLNEDRRQLSPEYQAQRRAERISRIVAAREEGKPIRAIAKEENISIPQVYRDIEASGVTPVTPEKVVGSDGKSYAAKVPKKDTFPCAGCSEQFEDRELVEYESADYCFRCFDKLDQEKSAAQEPKSEIEQSVDAALAKNKQTPPIALPAKERSSKEDREAYAKKTEASRKERHETVANEAKAAQQPGQLGPFSVLYVDPPWQYSARISDSRNIENQYPTLTLEELKALDIDRIAAKNCVLYLWVTAPLVEEALELAKAWGFRYKSQLVWVKEGGSPGLGHWWRINHEILFNLIKGDFPTPPLAARFSSVIKAKKGAHSEKPAKVRELLDRMYPAHAKVEIFAREKAKGWTSIGNEIDGADIRELLKKGVDPRQVELPLEATPRREPPTEGIVSGIKSELATPEAPQPQETPERAGFPYLCISCNKIYASASDWTTHRDVVHQEPGPRPTWMLLVEKEHKPPTYFPTHFFHISEGNYSESELRAAFQIEPSERLWISNGKGLDRYIESEIRPGYTATLSGDNDRRLLISGHKLPQRYEYACLICGENAPHNKVHVDRATGEITCPFCSKPTMKEAFRAGAAKNPEKAFDICDMHPPKKEPKVKPGELKKVGNKGAWAMTPPRMEPEQKEEASTLKLHKALKEIGAKYQKEGYEVLVSQPGQQRTKSIMGASSSIKDQEVIAHPPEKDESEDAWTVRFDTPAKKPLCALHAIKRAAPPKEEKKPAAKKARTK